MRSFSLLLLPLLGSLSGSLLFALPVSAADPAEPPQSAVEGDSDVALPLPRRDYEPSEEREPCNHYNPLRQPHFGDTHVHTAWSFDANSQDTRNRPADAYRFAKGEVMGIQPYDDNNQPLRRIQIDRPLDFTAVTDHSEFMGEIRMCTTAGLPGYWHPVCIAHRYLPQFTFATLAAYGLQGKNRWGFCGDNNEVCFAQAADTWKDIQRAAEDAYDRSSDCSFTSFSAYEWTGTVGTGQNLHHNVVFKNHQVPDRALSWIESESQVTLWDYLDQECLLDKPGCDAVVIPHNSNLSGGLMFETARLATDTVPAEPVTAAEATRRARWNTLFEVMQHKGSSECDNRTPTWSEDEYCGFEKLGYDSFGGKNTGTPGGIDAKWLSFMVDDEKLPQTKLPDESNFLRYALKKGLQQQAELGVNAFKYGLIAATDTHIAAPGLTMEKNHPGHGGAGMGSSEGVPRGLADELEYGPGGLAVLYAEENTRDSLFAAMQRREAYATSGTRPVVRFFGGWDYPQDVCAARDMVARGYAGGVPMGGDLAPPADNTATPTFIVSAVADSGTAKYPGNPLQRIQLIKGWYEDGELKEQVLDVAGGDNDASVDLDTCETTGSGHAQLCSVWRDDNFNANAQAFYYTRVLENPSCRWSQRICAEAGVRCDDPATITEGLENCCREDHERVIQERAWSSPIWYTPRT
ncbi:DUF3604 domain-containing protein [Pseudohalioglobus sediminis]|uniref:DUF3604 domain-containing protein n=1 Tax=Pseudohalioglobus sediminis TaxID=2606449 RepID=A0A5B0X4D3_9GAMM|nr:DUF3604 domain-containing protein [Pseudohalioglobus sediminis]KAA1194113.1 DUF3604 domain-containing protein [Pseudohalioglobus sediminis]